MRMTRVRWQIVAYAFVIAAVLTAGFVPGMALAFMLFVIGGLLLFISDPDVKFGPDAELHRLRTILAVTGHGVTMRVDENRRLMEGLQEHFPAVFSTHAWMTDVIRNNDQFFMALATQSYPLHLNVDGTINVSHGTIRAWPAAVPVRQIDAQGAVERPNAGYPLKHLTIKVQGLRQTSIDRMVGEVEHAIIQLRTGALAGERHDGFVGYQFELNPHGIDPLRWVAQQTVPEAPLCPTP